MGHRIRITAFLAAVFGTLLTSSGAGAAVVEWLPPSGPPDGKVSRVVSLAPSLTEILFETGSGELVVGVTRYDDWPPKVKSIKRVGGYLDIDLETIIGLKPDVVFCEPNSGIKNAVERLAGMGIHVGVTRMRDVESIISGLVEIGSSLGRAAEAVKKAGEMRARLGKVASAVSNLPPVGVIVFFNINPLMAAGRGTFTDSVISHAGGRNLADGSSVSYPIMDRERLSALDPDVIIDQSESAMGTSVSPPHPSTAIMEMKGLKSVANKRVYSLPGNYLFRPGPRIIDGIESLAATLHPDASGGNAR